MRKIKKQDWLIPLGLLLLIAIVLWLSPEERTLGARIKIVYIHVAFVWTGLIGILLTGLLSLGVIWRPFAQRLAKLLPTLNIASIVFFGIGFLLSVAAATINWGGIMWEEPRMVAALRLLSIASIVLVLTQWVVHLYFRALSYIVLAGCAIWINGTVRDAVHPTNPIFSSDSSSFAIATLSLTVIVIALATWFMVILQRSQSDTRQLKNS